MAEFQPSKYQEAIFDYVLNGNGNLVVEAVAGSGKTTTILEILKLIPKDKKVLFCAFNNTIVDELKERVNGCKNVKVSTIHSMGFYSCLRNIKGINKTPQDYKYSSELNKNIFHYTKNSQYTMGKNKFNAYKKNIIELFNLCRLNLAHTLEEIKQICIRYEIIPTHDEINVVLKLIQYGLKHQDTMDFIDMVWYPIVSVFDLNALFKYDYIFVDEAQDLSKAQREFILRCGNENTVRFVFVGDGNQAIYGFGAADPYSFSELKKLPNTKSMPLSVCYRCPKTIVEFVHKYVPHIEAQEGALEGEIRHDKMLADINDGDMILCRNNAPLVHIYNSYLRMGRKCFIKGKDIGNNLIDLIREHDEDEDTHELNADLKNEGLFSKLYKTYFDKRKSMMMGTGLDSRICDESPQLSDLMDKIETLSILSEGINTTAQLIDRISRIFTNDIQEGIILSTVHKAKGLEANNVYIARKDLFKSQSKNTAWEREQEENLEYVAYTRAKRVLGFLNVDIGKIGINIPLNDIQRQIDRLYTFKTPIHPNASRSISGITTMRGLMTKGNGIQLGESPKSLTASTNNFQALLSKKKLKKN